MNANLNLLDGKEVFFWRVFSGMISEFLSFRKILICSAIDIADWETDGVLGFDELTGGFGGVLIHISIFLAIEDPFNRGLLRSLCTAVETCFMATINDNGFMHLLLIINLLVYYSINLVNLSFLYRCCLVQYQCKYYFHYRPSYNI